MAALPVETRLATAAEPARPRDFRPRARKSRHDSRRGPLTAKPLQWSAACQSPDGKETPDKDFESPTDCVPAKRFVHHRHGSISPGRRTATAREGSPSSGRRSPARRAPSPGGLEPAELAAVQRRVQRVGGARLYLLQQQPGPHTFLVTADLPQHKYRVTIGPQTCSCGRAPLCLHVLFVMVRVLRVPENDQRLFCRTLKNFEVESLVQSFRRRRLSRVASLSCGEPAPSATLQTIQLAAAENSEDRSCPICLLELVNGESLVRCDVGCRNYLHHHCMTVWADACRREHERVLCPLCRAGWPLPPPRLTPGGGSPQLARRGGQQVARWSAGGSVPSSPARETARSPLLPRRAAMSASSATDQTCSRRSSLSPGSPQLTTQDALPGAASGSPRSSCDPETARSARRSSVVSCDPETARSARRGSVVSCDTEAARSARRGSHCEQESSRSPQLGRRAGSGRGSMRRATARLERRHAWVQVLGRELVQLVFSRDWQLRDTGVQRLSEEMAKLARRSADDLVHTLADMLAVLCADPVHKVFTGAIKCLRLLLQHLRCSSPDEMCRLRASLAPVVEALLLRAADANRRSAQLSAWTLSQLALGGDGQLLPADVGGLQLVLDGLLRDGRSAADSWQWWLGRLVVADQLVAQLPDQFSLAPPAGVQAAGHVARLAEFARRGLQHPHVTVGQLARRVFVQMALAAEPDQDAHAHIHGLMAALEPSMQARLQRRVVTLRQGACAGAAAAVMAPLAPQTPAAASRPRRPTFLPLDPAAVAADFKRKQCHLRRRAAGERATPLRAGLFSPDLLSTDTHTPSTMDCACPPELPDMATSTDSVDEIIVFPHNPEMEGNTPMTYTEEVDWRRGALLGTGSFSSCYQACDLHSGHLMAVKQVFVSAGSGWPEEPALLQEVRLLARLRHPHVLRLLGATRRPELLSLFTEWEAGGSVAGLLERYGPMRAPVIRRYTAHLVDGLAYLHDNHVLHRDLKGANLLVDSSGRSLKIGDLGTAAVLGAADTLPHELSGQVLGTLAFMAPEVVRGHHYGRSCDVWSVGCCVIEMATGQPPWDAHTCSNHFALLFMIAGSSTPPPVPCHLPDDLKSFVSDCHRMDGHQRPSAKQLLHYPCFEAIT